MCQIRIFLSVMFVSMVFVLTYSQTTDTMKLYFSINGFSLSQTHINQLDSFLTMENVEWIEIKAYTDFLGTKTYNDTLSEKRCLSVKTYLLSHEFSGKKIISCRGFGVYMNSSEENRTDQTDAGIPEHRRAEIIYTTLPPIIQNNQEEDTLEEILLSEEDLEIGNQIVLQNIFFYPGTPRFRIESEPTLRELLHVMKKYPNLKIEIQGHICCKADGEDGYDIINRDNFLSRNRAQAVYDYLCQKGIEKERMIYKGYGSAHKRFPEEKNEEEENMNRRVEIMILDK